jgi:large subunit ribosomal protein L25
MEMVALSATARSKDKPNVLRTNGKVPCILYGNEAANTSLECSHADLRRAYVKAGKSTLVDLDVAGKKVPVLFHQITFHPLTSDITHVDFYAVNMKKEIEAEVPIHFEGEAPAVKEVGGVLVTPYDHVQVKCLPSALPHHISVSLVRLAQIGDTLSIADLEVPAGVQILDDATAVIATIQEMRKEEEPLPAAPVEGAEGAVAEGEAKEGDAAAAAGEEGAAEGGKDKKKE